MLMPISDGTNTDTKTSTRFKLILRFPAFIDFNCAANFAGWPCIKENCQVLKGGLYKRASNINSYNSMNESQIT